MVLLQAYTCMYL